MFEFNFCKIHYFNRTLTFEAMLKQECGWFDNPKNSVGALTSRLSGDAANLQTVRIKKNLVRFSANLEQLEYLII